jgi:hypothetical protein
MSRRTTLTDELLAALGVIPNNLKWIEYAGSSFQHAHIEQLNVWIERYKGETSCDSPQLKRLYTELMRRHENDKAMMMKRIAQLETYVAQLELMPSDQTWAQATEATEAELNAIKYRTE